MEDNIMHIINFSNFTPPKDVDYSVISVSKEEAEELANPINSLTDEQLSRFLDVDINQIK